MHLRRAPQRVRVLHQVRAVAVRRQDRRAGEQPTQVRRRRALPGVRSQPLQPFVERRVGAERRLDRSSPRRRRRPARGPPTRLAARIPTASMPCVPLTSASPPWPPARSARVPPRASAAPAGFARRPRTSSSPWPISGSARFASGARSPDAPSEPCSGTDGISVAVQHLDHPVDDHRPHARMAERQDVRPQQQHRPRLLAGERPADGGRVRSHDAELERGGLRRIDPDVGQRAEPGGDAVDRVARRDDPLDHRAGGLHARPRVVRELDRGAARHRHDVRERQRSPHPDRHGGKATPNAERRAAAPVSRSRAVGPGSVPRGPRRRSRRPGTPPRTRSDATTSARSVPT